MELKKNLYKYQVGQNIKDSTHIATFLEVLPLNLEMIFNHETSNLTEILPPEEYDLNTDDVWKAFLEARDLYNKKVKKLIIIGKAGNLWEFDPKHKLTDSKLSNCGLSKKSLQVKLTLINYLWNNIVEYVEKQKMRFLNFMDSTLRKLVMQYRDFLKEILDSLKNIFKEIEIFCEILSILDALMTIPKNE